MGVGGGGRKGAGISTLSFIGSRSCDLGLI